MVKTEYAKVYINNKTGEIEKIEYDGNDSKCKDFQKIISEWLLKDGILIETLEFSENPKEEEVRIQQERRIGT